MNAEDVLATLLIFSGIGILAGAVVEIVRRVWPKRFDDWLGEGNTRPRW